MKPKAILGVIKDTFQHWWNDNTFELGAALAFYTLFSIAPVVVIAVAIAGSAFGKEAALHEFIQEVGGVAGPRSPPPSATSPAGPRTVTPAWSPPSSVSSPC